MVRPRRSTAVPRFLELAAGIRQGDPVVITLVLAATELVAPVPSAICAALGRADALVVCSTGSGKTEGICDYIERAFAGMTGPSVVMIRPRRTINAQVAETLRAVNVSGSRVGTGDPFSLPGTIADRYVCCLPSLGNRSKLNGDRAHWGEYWTYGDTGSPPVLTGQGAMASVLVIDEVRQVITDLLLSPCGLGAKRSWKPGSFSWLKSSAASW